MCENVNINVSETNETINIVSSEIQEVIDINVFETTEDVTLNITEEIIQVNINKVTSAEQIQSDWNETDVDALDFIKNKPTSTSDFINDGEDGINPFITAADIPPVTGFVPYTGATANVDLGEYEIKAGQVEFDQTPTGTAGVGVMRWNDSDGTVDLGLKGGNVTLQIGQESVLRVVNKTATNINLLEANYQAVRVTGAQGQRLKVDLAQAKNDNLSAETIGLVTETINNNQEGFITTGGIVRNINTTGSLQGETWADGDILYLSPTTAGNATKVKPTAPNHLVILGYVIHAHITQGSIFVKVDNGYELDELHNVKITSAANNNVLAYTSATDIWENKTVETALGYTPVTDARTISTSAPLSGGGDLTANRTLSISQASTSTDGFLSSTNWNTFNNKQSELFDFYTKRGIMIFDDMWYSQSSSSFINNNLLWVFSGGSQIVQSNTFFGLVPTTTQRGVTLFKTQSSATSAISFVIGNSSSVANNTIFYLGNGTINYETYVLFPILSDATQRFYFHFGFTNNSTITNPLDYVSIMYNEGTTFGYDNNLGGSPNFTFNNSRNGTRTRTINTSAVAINTWYKLRIQILCDTSVINFYVNDVLSATHNTNVPLTSTRVQPFMNFTKTIGTTNREVAVDYVAIKQDFSTLR